MLSPEKIERINELARIKEKKKAYQKRKKRTIRVKRRVFKCLSLGNETSY